MSHVFGPVPSRRLGRSLGVDLVPLKTCTYDCIYCQLGRTTCKTVERREWVPLDEVTSELESKLTAKPDYVTLSGSGEPTLFSRLGELVDRIKDMTDTPVAVLTNGSLLWQEAVQRQLFAVDLVIPSLDAGDTLRWQRINRPHGELSFEQVLSGLIAFRESFQGDYWLEILLLAGYTSTEAEIVKLAGHVNRIRPDRVQLTTAIRPPAESFARPVSPQHLLHLAALFNPPAEVVADSHGIYKEAGFSVCREEILAMLHRRPCSIDDIIDGLGMHPHEVVKYLEELTAEGLLKVSVCGGVVYHAALQGKPERH